MNQKPTVSQFGEGDWRALLSLFAKYRHFYGVPPHPVKERVFLEERLKCKESYIFIAKVSQQAVGFVQLYPSFSSVSLQRIWILNDLFVAEDFRRRGVAQSLLQATQDFSCVGKAKRLVLQTGRDNVQAQALYEKMGWKKDVGTYYYEFPCDADEGL